ncbi:hypothetical protein [Streptomyces roseoverticillatus]|uniref:hypothetical protein n=1 Tax=Streptomyces roseoverticillatus TaxID=66429 RepID=UPI0004BFFDDC|nr:hypothetical protein [Streptomyces roseoverticillatus]
MNPELLAAGVLLGPGLILGPLCLLGHRRARHHDDIAAAVLASFTSTPPSPPGEPRPLPEQQLAPVIDLEARRHHNRRAA